MLMGNSGRKKSLTDSTLLLKAEKTQQRRFVLGPPCLHRSCSADVPAELSWIMWTSGVCACVCVRRSNTSRRGEHFLLVTAVAATFAHPLLSELLVCCGHPQEDHSDTPAPTSLVYFACMHVFWSSWLFGIATASSLARRSPLCFGIFASPLCLSLPFSLCLPHPPHPPCGGVEGQV